MISIKNEHELEAMRQACKITAAARALAGEMVRPGVTTKQIDKAVHDFIVQQGARPSFLHYGGFPASACISVNNTVIHGIPGSRVLREGDIVSVDVGRITGASMETVLRLILWEDLAGSAKAHRRHPSELFPGLAIRKTGKSDL